MSRMTALYCALEVFKKKGIEKPTGGMKFTKEDREIKEKYTAIVKELTEIVKEIESSTLISVKKCSTCNAFQAPPNGKNGWCFMTHFTNSREANGYCSLHERKPNEKE